MDAEDDETDPKNAMAETILRDFNYKLRCMLMERNRKLIVTWIPKLECICSKESPKLIRIISCTHRYMDLV